MPSPASRAPLVLFSLVTIYIVLQSAWWAWLLLDRETELRALQQQLLAEGVTPTIPLRATDHTVWMVAGEGGVFVLLLLIALWLTFRTVRHEIALARQQRDFLLAVSHELRTPIAGLKLHLGTLRRQDLRDAQREELLSLARSEVDRLRALTEKILLATRLDEARVPLSLREVDVANELRALCSNARLTYAAGHGVDCSAPETLMLRTDADAFRSVLGNLLENASKYAPAGSTITVALEMHGGGCEVRVEDEGHGVPAEERSRIFHKFNRGGSEETREAKGTGLGLFIASRLMHSLGGRLEYRARAPHGSIFAATFPSLER